MFHPQVRRCVGLLLAMGHGKVGPADIEKMFAEPHLDSFPRSATMAPPYGLYLRKVQGRLVNLSTLVYAFVDRRRVKNFSMLSGLC